MANKSFIDLGWAVIRKEFVVSVDAPKPSEDVDLWSVNVINSSAPYELDQKDAAKVCNALGVRLPTAKARG